MPGRPGSVDRLIDRALCDALRDASVLLVLDNCEHMLDACAALIDVLLRDCPKLQILAISREPIGIPAEINWPVPPLTAPDALVSTSLADIRRSPAVRLFADRASAVVPQFTTADENAPAAACLDALTPDQLASRLDQRFRLLTGGNRAALPRQQTLRTTIDWNYERLSETQRYVFERLSVFASGWTLQAAEAVCTDDGVAADDVLNAVRQLFRKSLVVRIDVRHGNARYGMLETLRECAFGRLIRRRVGQHARTPRGPSDSEMVQRLDPAAPTTLLPFSGDGAALTTPVFEVLDSIHDNVRSALKWWLGVGRVTEALVLLRALCHLWIARGIPVDGRRWVAAVLDLAAATAPAHDGGAPRLPSARMIPPALHAQVLMFSAGIAEMQDDHEAARGAIHASIQLWRTLDDEVGLAQALNGLGFVLFRAGDFEAASG
jgi:predicted ATPase